MAVNLNIKTNSKQVSAKFKKFGAVLPRIIDKGVKQAGFQLVEIIRTKTLKGQEYAVTDELAGLFGFRVVPINPEKTLNFKIQEFRRDERDERRLIYEGTLSGDPVKDADRVVGQFIDANEKRLETFNKMRKK